MVGLKIKKINKHNDSPVFLHNTYLLNTISLHIVLYERFI